MLTDEVSANIESTLTLSLALRTAAKFSNGAAVTEGEGKLGKTFKGSFNICYWVQVEGLSELWVVRFPLLGLLPIEAMKAKFSCEIATLKFLQEKTKVRVPKLIGYGIGDDDISIPFMITQNVVGLPLTVYWHRFGRDELCVDRILNSLAQQYLELLSHPFEKIGSLRLTPDGQSWELGTSPLSVDQFDCSRDGLEFKLSTPYTSSLDYYISQANLFERLTNEQRNSVYDRKDAIQKCISSEVYRRIIPYFHNLRFDGGPFFLFHLDLHANNVITNSKWEVEAILDWEFTSTLPIEVAVSPPRCLMYAYRADEMLPHSENYRLYETRLRIFTEKAAQHLESSYSSLSRLGPYILAVLRTALSEKRAFFAWSASDIRNMFFLLWDHLALTTPIAIEEKDGRQTTEPVIFETEQEVINEMRKIIGKNKVEDWVAERLESLRKYLLERDANMGTFSLEGANGKQIEKSEQVEIDKSSRQ